MTGDRTRIAGRIVTWQADHQVSRVLDLTNDAAPLFRAAQIMEDFGRPWGVCGGWAIDLFIGHQTRPHADVDIAILRDDQARLRESVTGAHVEKVIDGRLVPWDPGERLELPIHEVHVSWPDGLHLEFLLNEWERASNDWTFRRDPRVRRPIGAVFSTGPGTPHIAPEVVLLYKSKDPGPKDDADFSAAVAHMTPEQRDWLRDAIVRMQPNHRWAESLDRMVK